MNAPGLNSTTLFPTRPLFVLRAQGMASGSVSYEGLMGRNVASMPHSGRFEGEQLNGKLVIGHATQLKVESTILGKAAQVTGLIALQTDDGELLQMTFVGRTAGADGTARLGVAFEANADGAYEWLNDVHAAALVETDGDDLVYSVFQLLGRGTEADEHALKVRPLYVVHGENAVGERMQIRGKVANRYFTMAENCRVEGERFRGRWWAGRAWGPHLMSSAGTTMHIDRRILITSDAGENLVKHTIGVTPSLQDPGSNERSWKVTAVFDAPTNGELGWMNHVTAVGWGRTEGSGVVYEYFEML